MLSMTYKGQRIDGVRVLEKKVPYMAPQTPELREMPGMPGAYLTDVKRGVLTIPIVLDVVAESPLELKRKAERVAAWLSSDKPEALIFDDDPGRTFYAILSGDLDPDRFVNFDSVPVTFICPEGEREGTRHVVPLSSDVTTIMNMGTAPAKPIFRGTATGSLTNIDLVTLDHYMRIGAPAPIGAPPPAMRTVLYKSNLTNVDGWSIGTQVDGGVVRGTMVSDGTGFVATDFGTPFSPYGYQGPARVRSVGSPAQHFQIRAHIDQMNSISGTGKVEIYMFNAAGQIIAILAFEDVYSSGKINQARLTLGVGANRREIVRQADSPPSWSDFSGIFEVERVGKHWTAYFAKVRANGQHHTRANFSFWDYGEDYQDPLAQFQIAIRKWGDPAVPATAMKVKDIEVLGFNFSQNTGPAYIAHAGDKIEINHVTGDILINDKSQIWLKDFAADYFELQPGENHITLNPHWLLNMEMEYVEKFK